VSRRTVISVAVGLALASGWQSLADINSSSTNTPRLPDNGDQNMQTVKTTDGVEIFYKDWGPKQAQPIMFHHGWPLSSDDWDTQMLFFQRLSSGRS
jgi:non-heme chloroperoxidase